MRWIVAGLLMAALVHAQDAGIMGPPSFDDAAPANDQPQVGFEPDGSPIASAPEATGALPSRGKPADSEPREQPEESVSHVQQEPVGELPVADVSRHDEEEKKMEEDPFNRSTETTPQPEVAADAQQHAGLADQPAKSAEDDKEEETVEAVKVSETTEASTPKPVTEATPEIAESVDNEHREIEEAHDELKIEQEKEKEAEQDKDGHEQHSTEAPEIKVVEEIGEPHNEEKQEEVVENKDEESDAAKVDAQTSKPELIPSSEMPPAASSPKPEQEQTEKSVSEPTPSVPEEKAEPAEETEHVEEGREAEQPDKVTDQPEDRTEQAQAGLHVHEQKEAEPTDVVVPVVSEEEDKKEEAHEETEKPASVTPSTEVTKPAEQVDMADIFRLPENADVDGEPKAEDEPTAATDKPADAPTTASSRDEHAPQATATAAADLSTPEDESVIAGDKDLFMSDAHKETTAPEVEPLPEEHHHHDDGAQDAEPQAQPEPTAEPQPEPTGEPRPEPTAEPGPEPTAEPQPEPTAEPQPEPSAEPQPTAQPQPNAEPTPEPLPHNDQPGPEPTAEPQPEPKPEPTAAPEPKVEPEPNAEPTAQPQPEPKAEPSPAEPTAEPGHDHEHETDEAETRTPFSLRFTDIDYSAEFADRDSGAFRKLAAQVAPELGEVLARTFGDNLRGFRLVGARRGSLLVDGELRTAAPLGDAALVAARLEEELRRRGARLGGNAVDAAAVTVAGVRTRGAARLLEDGAAATGYVVGGAVAVALLVLVFVVFAVVVFGVSRSRRRQTLKLKEDVSMAEMGKSPFKPGNGNYTTNGANSPMLLSSAQFSNPPATTQQP